MKGLYDFYSRHKINVDLLNGIQTEEQMMNIINNSLYFDNIKRRNYILANAKHNSQIAINSAVLLGAIVGFHPLPTLSELPLLAAIELGLITSILTIYGIKRTTSEKKEIIKESAKSSIIVSSLTSAGCAGYILGNGLKIIPLIGGLIDATVAGVTINRIGKFTIDYCEKLFKQELLIDYLKDAINSINSGVDELLKIANNYQK